MNKLKEKILLKIELWLDRANSNKYLNIALMSIIIVSVLIFFFSTYPDSAKRIHILLIPVIAGVDMYCLGSKNHVLRETANFIAGLMFVAFLFFCLSIAFMGFVILKSL